MDDTPHALMKQCTGPCGRTLPATPEYFTRAKLGKYGLDATCKDCEKRYRQEHKTEIAEQKRRYRQEHSEEQKQYNIAHSEEKREYNKRYRQEHPEYFKEKELQRPPRHIPYTEERREWHKSYREAHKDHYQEWHRQYRQTEKGKMVKLTTVHNRRSRKMAVQGTYTAQQIREQYDRQKGKCYYCHKKVEWGKHHIDHTFPLSRVAGTDIPANDISYLVLTCPTCNQSKHNKFPWEWPEGNRLL